MRMSSLPKPNGKLKEEKMRQARTGYVGVPSSHLHR